MWEEHDIHEPSQDTISVHDWFHDGPHEPNSDAGSTALSLPTSALLTPIDNGDGGSDNVIYASLWPKATGKISLHRQAEFIKNVSYDDYIVDSPVVREKIS